MAGVSPHMVSHPPGRQPALVMWWLMDSQQQEKASPSTPTLQISDGVTFSNVPLAKASHFTKPRSKDGEINSKF